MLSGDLFVVLLVHILFEYDGLFVQIADRIVVGAEDDVDPVAVQVGQEWAGVADFDHVQNDARNVFGHFQISSTLWVQSDWMREREKKAISFGDFDPSNQRKHTHIHNLVILVQNQKADHVRTRAELAGRWHFRSFVNETARVQKASIAQE